MTKHTPGPWEFLPGRDPHDNVFTVGRPHRRIASVFAAEETDNENAANARLIAAAPKMLAALKWVADSASREGDEFGMWAAVDAAIDKAEGK